MEVVGIFRRTKVLDIQQVDSTSFLIRFQTQTDSGKEHYVLRLNKMVSFDDEEYTSFVNVDSWTKGSDKFNEKEFDSWLFHEYANDKFNKMKKIIMKKVEETDELNHLKFPLLLFFN